MKRALQYLFAIVALVLLATPNHAVAQNVGIGTNTPDASALLELLATTQGLLIPRMTESQKFLISTPATGLLIYQTNTSTLAPWIGTAPTLWYYTGTAWNPINSQSANWSLTGNSGTTAGTNFLGTTDAKDLQIRTNNLERSRVLSGGNLTLSNTNNTAEQLQFLEPSGSGAYYSAFRAGVQSGNVTYTLPVADGTTFYQLTTNGTGTLSWVTKGTAPSNTNLYWFRSTGNKSLGSKGTGNSAAGDHALAAGIDNTTGNHAYAISKGYDNNNSGIASTIAGGMHHQTAGNYATLIGGQINYASAPYSVISGGCYFHTTNGDYSVAWAGRGLTTSAAADYSMAWGWTNTVSTPYTVAFSSDTLQCKIGIRKNNPSQALDVNGNIRYSGALMPNNIAGTAFQILKSAGANTAPTWGSLGSGPSWSLTGDASTDPTTYFLGTIDSNALIVKTSASERLRVLPTGLVGIGTGATINHQLHVVNSSTNDEVAAVYGVATASTPNNAIGVWGNVSGTSSTNTGAIGVMATGNRNGIAGQTNIALEIVDGEIAMGRTSQTSSGGTIKDPANSGTAYSAQGPSGVIEFTLGTGGNLATSAPTNNVFQSFASKTITNRYVKASSIILLNVISKSDDGNAPSPVLSEIIPDVESRAAGSFVLRIGMIPKQTSGTNYQNADKIRIGYVIINPSL